MQTSRFTRLFDFIGVRRDAKDFNEKYLYELGKGAFLVDGALFQRMRFILTEQEYPRFKQRAKRWESSPAF